MYVLLVDLFSNFSCVHFQYSTNASKTLEAKQAFGRFAESHGVAIQAYHADNGCFMENLWQQDAHKKGQKLSYSGVNVHFQNGRAEKEVCDLQDMAQTQLIHAQRHWLDTISSNLWPHTMHMANSILNSVSLIKNKCSPTELFTAVPVVPNAKHTHTFGCPAYVLDARMQAGHKIPKWAK